MSLLTEEISSFPKRQIKHQLMEHLKMTTFPENKNNRPIRFIQHMYKKYA